jgi:hypothetical protein
MLNERESVKEFEGRAAEALRALLEEVPSLKVERVEIESALGERRADLVVRLEAFGRRRVLVCEVKANGQPRNVRMALHQLRGFVAFGGDEALPVVIAPYLSAEAQALCREDGAGYLDLHGNARIVFDGVFIERIVAGAPPAERRSLKSLFKPKSAQVLRLLLRDPGRAWRVAELAEAAGVSLGHVSNVRAALLAREWAQASDEGLHIAEPDALLDAWRDEYEPPAGRRLGFYTTLHGSGFEQAVREVLGAEEDGQAMLASFSAAQWLAPYGRTGSQYFYADAAGLARLKDHLQLSAAAKGENVVVSVLKDEGLFRDAIEPAPGILCTSAVQTYLDLAAAGERGREAAEHLRQERLAWRS